MALETQGNIPRSNILSSSVPGKHGTGASWMISKENVDPVDGQLVESR